MLLTFERRRAERRGIHQGRGGAVTAIQRFGSALNLNVHFHTLSVQGVFVDDSRGGLRFVPNPEPTDLEVVELLASVSRRITRLVKRHGISLERPSEEIDAVDPLATDSPFLSGLCGASVVGRVATGPRAGQPVMRISRASDATLITSGGERHAHAGGFDLHANVAVPAGDRDRLEHLCGYVLRPPVAQDALQLTGDGKILLTMNRRWRDGTRAVLFEPHELIEKLAALIPKPRINLLLYHGVVGPAARMRNAAVSAARGPLVPSPSATVTGTASAPFASALAPPPAIDQVSSGKDAVDSVPLHSLGTRAEIDDVMPRRPGSGRRPHTPWADLLQRTFGIDILACPGCGGRLRFLATIEDPKTARKILNHLGIPTELPEPLPARSPPWEELRLPGIGDWPQS